MKIGVFLGYGPNTKLTNEGLGRYIGGLLQGFLDAGEDVVIALPVWLKDSLEELFQEFDISADKIRFVVCKKIPFSWRIYSWLKPKKKKKSKYRIKEMILKKIQRVGDFFFTTSSVLLFFLGLLLVLLVALILLIPGLLLFLVYLMMRLVRKVLRKGKDKIKNNDIIANYDFGGGIKSKAMYYYNNINASVRKRLVRESNRIDVDLWFIPTLYWEEAEDLKAVSVNVLPDMVTQLYAFDFSGDSAAVNNIDSCREVIRKGKYFITYSDYVNRTVLQDIFHKYEGRGIPISFSDLNRWISSRDESVKMLGSDKDFSEIFAKKVLRRLTPHNAENEYFFRNCFLDNTDYIFYPSQVRPHKNIETLIRAVHHLIRERNKNIKLVLTCNEQFFSDRLKDFVKKSGMSGNIICMHGVSVQELAALYKCAKLVVNPTLYEGGFPIFTLGEGMSVGTPSVMGNMPQTMDVMKDYPLLVEEAIFDAYDVLDMARVIEWGLDNTEKLYNDELEIYRKYENRDNSVVAAEYVEYFKEVLKKERAS